MGQVPCAFSVLFRDPDATSCLTYPSFQLQKDKLLWPISDTRDLILASTFPFSWRNPCGISGIGKVEAFFLDVIERRWTCMPDIEHH